jgi:hypothetical protein
MVVPDGHGQPGRVFSNPSAHSVQLSAEVTHLAHYGAHTEHSATPVSKYLSTQSQSGGYLVVAAEQISQTVKLEHLIHL